MQQQDAKKNNVLTIVIFYHTKVRLRQCNDLKGFFFLYNFICSTFADPTFYLKMKQHGIIYQMRQLPTIFDDFEKSVYGNGGHF